MFCPKCGNDAGESNFCAQCGEPLEKYRVVNRSAVDHKEKPAEQEAPIKNMMESSLPEAHVDHTPETIFESKTESESPISHAASGKYICLTCRKTFDKHKYLYDLSNPSGVGLDKICKECAKEIGIGSMFTAGAYTNTKALKKYVSLHPEAQPLLNRHLSLVEERKKAAKAEAKLFKEKIKEKYKEKHKHDNHKKKTQCKCTCLSCGKVFYYDISDSLKMISNAAFAAAGSIYSANNMKDLSKCPVCNSTAVTIKQQTLWFDKKGNCVEIEDVE